MPIAVLVALLLAAPEPTPASSPAPGPLVIDGHPIPVRVLERSEHAGDGKSAPAPALPEAVKAWLPKDVVVQDVIGRPREVLVRVWDFGHQDVQTAWIVRAPLPRGPLAVYSIPVNDRGGVPRICAERWLVIALESRGTLVWDLAESRAVGVVPGVGRFVNAASGGPACSPDGRYAALPTPYEGQVSVVRLADAKVVASVAVAAAGTIRWTDRELVVTRTFLPYE